MGQLVYLKGVATLELDNDKCIGCGMCMVVCPHEVFTLRNGTAVIENLDSCMECGACEKNCPADALYVKSGVGCAAAVINAALGRESSSCCCVLEEGPKSGSQVIIRKAQEKRCC